MLLATVKLATIAIAVVLAINGAVAAPDSVAKVITQREAFEVVKGLELPAGVTLTGAVDAIKEPAKKPTSTEAELTISDNNDDHKEWFGGFGGWRGLGPYRFGFSCGGIGGWAYPLGYWNTFGFGLYGDGCGLGIPFDGLFYC
ncbi:unnamed protein product [Globisporangium polare]